MPASRESAGIAVDSGGDQVQGFDDGPGGDREATDHALDVESARVGCLPGEQRFEPGSALRRFGNALVDFGLECSFAHISDSTPEG